MMRLPRFAVILLAAFVAAPQAECTLQTLTFTRTGNQGFVFPMFDATLGSLVSVAFTATAYHSLAIEVNNPTDSDGYFGGLGSGSYGIPFSYSGPVCPGSSDWSSVSFPTHVLYPSLYIPANSRTSERTEATPTFDLSGSDPACLPAFVGPDIVTISLTLGWDPQFPDWSPGLQPIFLLTNQILSGELRYNYMPHDYQEVPEPVYGVLIVVGLVVFAVRSKFS